MEFLKDSHYFQLPSQGNIYTFSCFSLADGSSKILVATLKREVFCFEYQKTNDGSLKPHLKEIAFTYIPIGAEIISLDVFNKSHTKNDLVIGIAIVKNNYESKTMESFLNIYSDWEETTEINLDNIAQNCLNIELNFVPYHLSHTYLITWYGDIISKETIFLLTGSDGHIHIFRESSSVHSYKEVDLKEYFPEFHKTPSIVKWIDCLYYSGFESRLTALACECGYLRISKLCVKTTQLLFTYSTSFINDINSVKLYFEKPYANISFFQSKYHLPDRVNETPVVNLICVNSILPAVFFRDLLRFGLQKYDTLNRLEGSGVLTCCEVADIDFDGINEILIGSSAQELNVYKFSKETGIYFSEERQVVSPVHAMKYIDMTGDGVKELLVMTLKGVYIYQHDHNYIEHSLQKKVQKLLTENRKK